MSRLNREATYTYAVARPFDPARIADVRGVDGAPVRLIGYRNVVAVVSAASPGELDEAALSTRLERLDELEMLARSHDAVVASVCAHAVTLPFRLAIIHRGDAGVVDMLRREYAHLVTKLDRLSGHVELGVKVYIDSTSPSPPPRNPDESRGSTDTTSGRRYLQLRKDQQRSRDEAWRLSAAAAAHADAELRMLASAARLHRPHQGQLCPDRGDNLLNAAYLVDVELVDTFTARVRDLDGELLGARVEVTGPWAPYSFVDDDRQ
jgi:hypothetical protein